MTTWRKEILDHQVDYHYHDEIIACTLTDEGLDVEFDGTAGTPCGAAFTAWSETRVYFPATHDGSEWVESVPRNPCDEATDHVGTY